MTILKTLLAASLALATLTAPATAGNVTLARAVPGDVPASAMPSGHDTKGRALYSCTALLGGQYQPGRLGPGDGVCHVARGGQVIRAGDYFVLTGMGSIWAAPLPGAALPDGAFVAGGTQGAPLYACRAYVGRGVFPGRIGAETDWRCAFAVNGVEAAGTDFDVLLR